MSNINLNNSTPETDGNYSAAFRNNSTETLEISVFFRDIQKCLLTQIKEADAVFGCVAWLTDFQVIEALSHKKLVSIIVQKEDFLRPDLGEDPTGWKQKLRVGYDSIPKMASRDQFDNILRYISTNSDLAIDPIRCVGNHNKDKTPAFPRMHNKFLIFAKVNDNASVVPYSIWTGSFNLTKNAGVSLENAVIIKKQEIVNAYVQEFGQICALSEPLDWTSTWVEPQWRMGT
jgi:hypothetical protein